MSRPADRRAGTRTFEQLWAALEQVPEDCLGEIVAGDIETTPRPNPPHTDAASDLGGLLTAWFRFAIGGPGGWVIRDEPRIRFGDEIRVPDLAGWRAERFESPPSGPYLVIPDWICEVLSARTARVDRTEKMPLYARHEVRHLWLLEPVLQTLEVYRLHTDGWFLAGAFGADAKVRAEPFDAMEIDLTLIWGPAREPAAE